MSTMLLGLMLDTVATRTRKIPANGSMQPVKVSIVAMYNSLLYVLGGGGIIKYE